MILLEEITDKGKRVNVGKRCTPPISICAVCSIIYNHEIGLHVMRQTSNRHFHRRSRASSPPAVSHIIELVKAHYTAYSHADAKMATATQQAASVPKPRAVALAAEVEKGLPPPMPSLSSELVGEDTEEVLVDVATPNRAEL